MRRITVGVVTGEDDLCLLITAAVDQPTRRFGEEPDEEELDDRRQTLEGRRDTPRPVVVDAEGTEGGPGGDDGAREPEGVIERGKRGTLSRVGDL